MGRVAGTVGLWLMMAAAGCDGVPEDAAGTTDAGAGNPSVAAAPPLAADVMQKWSRSCVLCHVDGNGGAPRLGNEADWQPRLAKGRDILLQHTLEGYNNMPPLGYCMACERDDFVALINFMAGVP